MICTYRKHRGRAVLDRKDMPDKRNQPRSFCPDCHPSGGDGGVVVVEGDVEAAVADGGDGCLDRQEPCQP